MRRRRAFNRVLLVRRVWDIQGRNLAPVGLALIAAALFHGQLAAEDFQRAAEDGDRSSIRSLIRAQQSTPPTIPALGADSDPVGRSIFGERSGRLPSVVDGRFQLPPLMAATTETKNIGNGRLPDGFREDDSTPLEPLPESGAERGFDNVWTAREWAAPNTFANPRYFEDRMLERHGHQRWGHLQPLASGARFFATVPMLPYLMTVKPPCEAEYSLGHFRAGSRAPAMLQRPPYERRAALVEGAAIAGGIIALP